MDGIVGKIVCGCREFNLFPIGRIRVDGTSCRHGARHAAYAEVKWHDLQQILARAQSDVLFIFDTCFTMTAAQQPQQTNKGTKEYLVASSRF